MSTRDVIVLGYTNTRELRRASVGPHLAPLAAPDLCHQLSHSHSSAPPSANFTSSTLRSTLHAPDYRSTPHSPYSSHRALETGTLRDASLRYATLHHHRRCRRDDRDAVIPRYSACAASERDTVGCSDLIACAEILLSSTCRAQLGLLRTHNTRPGTDSQWHP